MILGVKLRMVAPPFNGKSGVDIAFSNTDNLLPSRRDDPVIAGGS